MTTEHGFGGTIKAIGSRIWGGVLREFAEQAKFPQAQNTGGQDPGQFSAALVPEDLCVYGRAMWTWLQRNARPERVELIQKYLKRWKIDRIGSVEPRPVPVGA